jgi:hypothetical protein
VFWLCCFFFWIPESPRYFFISGRSEDAMQTLRSVAHSNKSKIPNGTLKEYEAEERGNFAQLLSVTLWRSTLLLWVIWLTNSLVYYGIVIMTPDYFSRGGNDVYLPTFITTFAEIPGVIVAAILVNKIGRRKTQALLFFVCGICSGLLIFRSSVVIATIFAIGARSAIYGSFAAVYVYTPEVYPTSLRGTGMGSACAVARVGGVLTPYIVKVLGDLFFGGLPLTIFALSCLAATVASISLPIETANRKLEDFLSSNANLTEDDKNASTENTKNKNTISHLIKRAKSKKNRMNSTADEFEGVAQTGHEDEVRLTLANEENEDGNGYENGNEDYNNNDRNKNGDDIEMRILVSRSVREEKSTDGDKDGLK